MHIFLCISLSLFVCKTFGHFFFGFLTHFVYYNLALSFFAKKTAYGT